MAEINAATDSLVERLEKYTQALTKVVGPYGQPVEFCIASASDLREAAALLRAYQQEARRG